MNYTDCRLMDFKCFKDELTWVEPGIHLGQFQDIIKLLSRAAPQEDPITPRYGVEPRDISYKTMLTNILILDGGSGIGGTGIFITRDLFNAIKHDRALLNTLMDQMYLSIDIAAQRPYLVP